MRDKLFKGCYISVEVYENKHQRPRQEEKQSGSSLLTSNSEVKEIPVVKAKNLEKANKKEIERVFSYFGPLKYVMFNSATGKATITFDLDKFKSELGSKPIN